jgi:hypothetical protein
MNWQKASSSDLEIKELRSTIQNTEIKLTWFWPKEIDFVYIYKASADNLGEIPAVEERDLKLYTREEYKANQGYIGKLDTIGRYAYRILPGQRRDGRLIAFIQENEDNLIYITGGRAKIYFTISYKNKLLHSRKKVKISIMTELPLERNMLCFVKKKEAVPNSIDDGTWFPFVQDFPTGKTELPEIEMDKNEFISIFFSKGRQSTDIYELIPR